MLSLFQESPYFLLSINLGGTTTHGPTWEAAECRVVSGPSSATYWWPWANHTRRDASGNTYLMRSLQGMNEVGGQPGVAQQRDASWPWLC